MPDSKLPFTSIEAEMLVATCRPDGTPMMRNAPWVSLFGKEEDLWERLVNEDQDTARQNLVEAVHGALITHALFMVKREDRDIPVPVLLHFVPVSNASQDSSSSVAILGEVLSEPSTWTESQTERHRMETLGRMTMGMTHDFNNLLSGILGHISLWREQRALNESTDAGTYTDEHIETIERAARDGAELIQKVQRYIRQEARHSFETIDLTALILDCLSFTRPYWYNEPRRQGIAINVEQTLGAYSPIMGSSAELRDVLVNLILNAVHAMPEGGTLSFSGDETSDSVRIRISDTGTGMTEEVRRRIFEPLYSTKGNRGTGMGLAVTAGIVREHGGVISVTSRLGKGTTFHLEFPVSGSDDLVETAPSVEDRAVGSLSILVVDDEQMVRNVVARLLQLRGHDVASASSGAEALDMMSRRSFDVVFTDQGMPEMSGRELARHIGKQENPPPVVLLTGDTDLKVDEKQIKRVVSKPFKIEDLEAAISAVQPA